MSKLLPEDERPDRRYQTIYLGDKRMKRRKNSTNGTSGYPKAEDGSIDGAVKAIGKGYVRKVQCVDRWTASHEVKWTAEAGERVPGVKLIPVKVYKGEHE